MHLVLLLINDAPYYDKKVTKEGEDSKNPNTNLQSFVFHEVVTAWEFIDWGLALHSLDWFLSVAAENEAIEFPVLILLETSMYYTSLSSTLHITVSSTFILVGSLRSYYTATPETMSIKNEFIFYLRVSTYSWVIKFTHCQSYRETEPGTPQWILQQNFKI